MPKVFIIITTWNSEKYLSELFLSLHEMDYPKEDWHLVAVDNASKDGTLEKLRAWQIKIHNFDKLIVNGENRGFSSANNQGIKYAMDNGADYVVLLNDDTLVTSNWLNILIDLMENDERLGIAQPLIMRYPEKNKINNFGNALQYCGFGYSLGEGLRKEEFFNKNNSKIQNSKFKIQNSYEPSYCSFTAVAIKRHVFETIGVLDELYFAYHEDTDFCLRARLQGWKLQAVKNSIVYHNYKFPAKKNKIRYFWLEKNRIYLMLKFFKIKTLLLIAPACLVIELGLVIFSIIRGFFWQRAKAYFWVMKHLFSILKNRRDIQKARKFSDKKLFEFIVPTVEFQEIKNPLLDKIGNPILKCYFKLIKKFVR
ncbi:MAG: glycosyltransferase family 2 protein [Candidatus Kuenenbacteria bacterium]